MEQTASRTAVLVCQGRAAADGFLATDRFSDPVAIELLDDAERVVVDQVRAGSPPDGFAARSEYEMVRGTSEVMVPRTVAIDAAVRASAAPQAVLLGAGLDSRAWRMDALADVTVFEVDHPASQDDKRRRIGDRQPVCGRLVYAPVDFRNDDLPAALADVGHRASEPTTWVWEGVVPYLTREAMTSTLAAVAECSAPGSRLVVNYQAPSLVATAGRLLNRAIMLLARRTSPMAGEPWRSLWTADQMRQALESAGFHVKSDDDLYALRGDLEVSGLSAGSMRNGRVVVAER
ncbi:class I SAM-dependent methyltransferase [Aeromicrobium sp.]|uniref:class I SAM-dependent methyltransferase n=1 Tax=Aeromicrobium sp. TaxID=1871063 RepID=UPI003C4742C3